MGKKLFCKMWLRIGMAATSECYQTPPLWARVLCSRETCDLKNNTVKTGVTGHLLVYLVQLKIIQV